MEKICSGITVYFDKEDLPKLNNGLGWGIRQGGGVVVWFGRKKCLQMHRAIMEPPPGMVVDHINGNRSDNRKKNLRICTRAQNMWNRNANRNKFKVEKHGFKGIVKNKKPGLIKKWRAGIQVNGARYCSRYYKTRKEAALAYNELAKKYHGEFARLNDVLKPF